MFSKNLILFILVTSLIFISVIGKKARMVSAEVTQPGQFSYTVAIIGNENIFICGGGIIGIKWILTAANCITSYYGFNFQKELTVIIGTNDFKGANESNRFEVPVDTAYIPSDYNPDIQKADIAVLSLTKNIFHYPTSYRLQRLDLPTNNSTIYNVDLRAVVSGFGAIDESFRITFNSTQLMDMDIDGKLRAAPVKIVSNDEYKKIPNRKWDLGEYQFLAKMVKQSTVSYGLCYADIGNPLVFDSQTIIGIVIDISESCDEREHPSVYTKVVNYLDFIYNALDDNVTKGILYKRYTNDTLSENREKTRRVP